jgi:hypothetical protein
MKVIAGRAKELEEIVERMDVEHKSCIVDLESIELATPLEQCEVRIAELKNASATIVLRLEDAQKLLDNMRKT